MNDHKTENNLMESRYRLLHSINKSILALEAFPDNSNFILDQCCSTLVHDQEYCLCWAGCRKTSHDAILPAAMATSTDLPQKECYQLINQILVENITSNPAAEALTSKKPVIIRDVLDCHTMVTMKKLARATGFRSCCSTPIYFREEEYGVLTIHSEKTGSFVGCELDFIQNMAICIGAAMYAGQTVKDLQVAREFTSEIFDTVQNLMISISHCGEILSFNTMAEQVTGFSADAVKEKYWVDVLLDKKHRRQSQQLISSSLINSCTDINFQAPLRTAKGHIRTIDWHGFIRQHIEKGQVGMVLFGTDVTEQLAINIALDKERAKWENIFSAMQDPVLIVGNNGLILDANPATLTAARKRKRDIIGKSVCGILHGSKHPCTHCNLITHLNSGKSRIIETELQGLNGSFLLTFSPLEKFDGDSRAVLLLARDLTEEEQRKAEALRAAQLASIGELAAGVAHEINNPINAIINYAQILKDILPDKLGATYLANITEESKRIATITMNLLNFSRKHEESPEPVNVNVLLEHCLQLIHHQFKRDGIMIKMDLDQNIPNIFCNLHQIQQVLFNVFSNARYALNERYKKTNSEKIIDICDRLISRENRKFVRLTITDRGTGIKHDILDRLMDPFFSTKPSGQGTGLGLSISHGLVKDNGGYFTISSTWKSHTTVTIDLPVRNGKQTGYTQKEKK